MFGFIKNLFGKGEGKHPAPVAPPGKPATPAPTATTSPAPAKPSPTGPVETTAIHLEAIVAKLPPELKSAVKKSPDGKATVPIPTHTILEQMPSGVVKVPFGDVRKAAPAGTFADEASHDDTLVSIPLPEILASINPALLKRRPNQKKVEVPDDVTGLFHKGGIAAPPPAPEESQPAAPAPPARAAEKPGPPPPPAPAPKPAEPAAPIAVSPALREMMAAASAAAKPPAPAPAPVPRPPAPPPPAAPKPPSPPPSPVAAPPPAAPAPAAAEVGELSVPLADVSKDWPEPVRAELTAVTPDSTLSLPLADVGNAIRAGKIVFTWKQLRIWIKPAPISVASGQDATSLTLPLAVVVPLFMAKSQPVRAQRKAAFDENIPDMFAAGKGGPAPAPASAPAAPTTVAPPPPPAPPVTPNQSVQKACGLPGVAGALLVSQDGFLVANQLPPSIKGETVAAFLPQIFGRMSQNAKEMNLGELNGLTWTVDNVPWQLCKTGNLYFAVLGRAGESLPSAQLNSIAAEIGRQTKQ